MFHLSSSTQHLTGFAIFIVILTSLPTGNIDDRVDDHVTILIYTWLCSVQIAFMFFSNVVCWAILTLDGIIR